jgi:hypothetical protein
MNFDRYAPHDQRCRDRSASADHHLAGPLGTRGPRSDLMREVCSLVWSVLVVLFRSRASLEAEILILRHQLNIQRLACPAWQSSQWLRG